ncbi:uncharacterized protein G2W53_035486 [Senna tora]|uniref:Uncharacterized protein n=1 Tax=Senna tora TaxID=362788 RepID=A0A834W4Y8_9FABA|nr:uncharacterized protein G2W53_035486 [Senna tora]
MEIIGENSKKTERVNNGGRRKSKMESVDALKEKTIRVISKVEIHENRY